MHSGIQRSSERGAEGLSPDIEPVSVFRDRIAYTIYALSLATSISLWFRAIQAPLRSDETGTYWLIGGGLPGIWSKRFISLAFPTYQYILWFSTRLIGTSEIALRIPSLLAMLGAAYLLYLAARELLGREVGIITSIIFSLNSTIIFAAIDVRPYAFAVLVTNGAILVLFRLRNSDSTWLAGLLGLFSALIVYFHYLFAGVLPAILICFVAFRYRHRKIFWRQFGTAFAVFILVFLPLIPGLQDLFHTAGSHIVPRGGGGGPLNSLRTIVPDWLVPATTCTVFVSFLLAALRIRPERQIPLETWQIAVCTSLALIPALILYWVTYGLSVDVFSAGYHRLGAVPGISICWAIIASRFRIRAMRLLFCLVLVIGSSISYLSLPLAELHSYSWKYALQATERNASEDNSPVVIFSNFIESNYEAMPIDSDSAKASKLFAPLSYYTLSVPVVPLPEGLNEETARDFSTFLEIARKTHKRFLAVGHSYSYPAMDWIARYASNAYDCHTLGVFEGVKVLEFVPRGDAAHQENAPPTHSRQKDIPTNKRNR